MLSKNIVIGNAGADIAYTNYFDSEAASSGLFYISWNASAARILVPDSMVSMIGEMKTGRICVISRGQLKGVDSLELMFDDDSDSPFALHVGMQSADRAIRDDNKPFAVTAWTSKGKVAEWQGKYRVVRELPCMEPWPGKKSSF